MKWKEAVEVLDQCERSLRKLVAEAASEGDYGSVLRIADIAKAVGALADEGRSSAEVSPPTHEGTTGAEASKPSRGAHSRASDTRKESYPRFFRRGNELVKVGWSRTERREYNHRAPRVAIDAAASAVRQLGGKGRLFNGDALLPLKDPSTGNVLPDYQAYVALAWLTQLGVVDHRGRKAGYSLVDGKQIESAIQSAWPELPEWRG